MTTKLEDCPICSKIPDRCSSSHWYDEGVPEHHSDVPPEVEQLTELCDHVLVGNVVGVTVLQCPLCGRVYVRQSDFVGENSMWTWQRHETYLGDRPPDSGNVPATVEHDSDRVIVKVWIASPPQLIRRSVTVYPADAFQDEVVVQDTYASSRKEPRRIFASIDAFRACCGEPTMPIEQCPICTRIPANCHESDATPPPPELQQLEHFLGEDVQRCPTCHRLYLYEVVSFGNDIYTGNDSSWSYERHDTDDLFDTKWCVRERLPEWGISSVSSDRFFPHHQLVNIGYRTLWGALDRSNQLVVLDSAAAIVTLIARDPPRVTHDLELAKRYALFVDRHEKPDDDRLEYLDSLGWGRSWTPDEQRRMEELKTVIRLAKGFKAGSSETMPCVSERDGDNVVVRFWVTSQQRLIQRSITVPPNGLYTRDDTVIAEKLPIR